MKADKRRTVLLVILFQIILLVLVIGLILVFDQTLDEKFDTQVQEIVGNVYQQQAIMDLCEVKGRVDQVKKLYPSKVNEDILMNELKYISSFQDSNNPYLKDFKITITSSNVGEVCEEVLSQIKAQIDFIKLATEGA